MSFDQEVDKFIEEGRKAIENAPTKMDKYKLLLRVENMRRSMAWGHALINDDSLSSIQRADIIFQSTVDAVVVQLAEAAGNMFPGNSEAPHDAMFEVGKKMIELIIERYAIFHNKILAEHPGEEVWMKVDVGKVNN